MTIEFTNNDLRAWPVNRYTTQGVRHGSVIIVEWILLNIFFNINLYERSVAKSLLTLHNHLFAVAFSFFLSFFLSFFYEDKVWWKMGLLMRKPDTHFGKEKRNSSDSGQKEKENGVKLANLLGGIYHASIKRKKRWNFSTMFPKDDD